MTESNLKVVHGRGYNNKAEHYFLPADEEEHARLDRQSYIIKLFFGTSYEPVELVRRVLTPGGQKLEVLDIGTGSGAWAIDMAKEFPHVTVTGMDVARPKVLDSPELIPSNCKLEIADANEEHEEYLNRFSVVHTRCAQQGISDFDLLLYKAAKWLKPGGVLLPVHVVAILIKEDGRTPFPLVEEGHPDFTWFVATWAALWSATNKKGPSNVNSMFFWGQYLKDNPNYEDVQIDTRLMPIWGWKEDASPEEKRASDMMRENMIFAFEAHRPVLIEYFDGDEQKADHMIQQAVNELKNPPFRASLRWQFMSAVRKDCEWIPRPESANAIDLNFNPLEEFSKIEDIWYGYL